MTSSDVYLVDAVRTPMARPFSRLQEVNVSDLAAAGMAELTKRYHLTKHVPDYVILGNAVSAGTGQNFVRKAISLSGLPMTVPGMVLNAVCGSGMQAIMSAAQMIKADEAHIILTGGAESVSHTPELIFKTKHKEKKARGLHESLMHDGLWCSLTDQPMGSLCEKMVKAQGITREEQDDEAFSSYQKSARAQEAGIFKDEIIGVRLPSGAVIKEDGTIRKNVSRDTFKQFAPSFSKNGTLTAANSSSPSDGASVTLACSQEAVEVCGFKPLAKIRGYVAVAGKPEDTFMLAGKTIKTAIKQANLSLKDIDLMGLAEGFAAQAIWTRKELRIPSGKMNIYGGDVALGHPLGACGARVITTLAHALKREKKRFGVACVCLGGGEARAIILESV